MNLNRYTESIPMARRSKGFRASKQLPQTIHELVAAGGPETLARAAAEAAAHEERKFWLNVLQNINQDDLDEQDLMFCALYIRSLRRKLGIRVRYSKAEIREQTRLRVRRFRKRLKSGDRH